MLSGARKQLTQADFIALESQVKALRNECRESRQLIGEVQSENKQLKAMLEEVNHRVETSTARLSQQFDDLRQSIEQRFGTISLEGQATARDLASLQTRVALLASSQESASSMAHEHTSQLKDVAVLRTQQSFLQQSVERSEQSSLESSRLMTQLRAELAGLQQRHASLASSSGVEHSSHKTQHGELRSLVEDCVTRLQGVETRLSVSDGTATATAENGEKLKRAAKRHELLLQARDPMQPSCNA